MCSSSLGRCMHTVSIFGKREFGWYKCVCVFYSQHTRWLHKHNADGIIECIILWIYKQKYYGLWFFVCSFCSCTFARSIEFERCNIGVATATFRFKDRMIADPNKCIAIYLRQAVCQRSDCSTQSQIKLKCLASIWECCVCAQCIQFTRFCLTICLAHKGRSHQIKA